MSAHNRPDFGNKPDQPNHSIVLCFVTDKGHELGKSTLKQVDMAPAGTDIGEPLAPQLPREMADLMRDVLTTIHAEGLQPIWPYERLEIEVGSALLLSGNQPVGTPYEVKIPVRPAEQSPQAPLAQDVMEPSVAAESNAAKPASYSPSEASSTPPETPMEDSTYTPAPLAK